MVAIGNGDSPDFSLERDRGEGCIHVFFQVEQVADRLNDISGREGARMVIHRPEEVRRGTGETCSLEVLPQHFHVLVGHLKGDVRIELREKIRLQFHELQGPVRLPFLCPEENARRSHRGKVLCGDLRNDQRGHGREDEKYEEKLLHSTPPPLMKD